MRPLCNTAIWSLPARTFLPHSGTSVLAASDEHPADESELRSILQQFGLYMLNTWSSKQKATSLMNGQASQIDYVCTRMQNADKQARLGRSTQEAVVGARYPVMA